MPPIKRYAEGTTVPPERSRAEVQTILGRHGVTDMGFSTTKTGDSLMFLLGGRSYRLTIDQPNHEWIARNTGPRSDPGYVREREFMRRWRATVLMLKAKLEFADGDTSTPEVELLPYLITSDRRTIGEIVTAGDVALLGSGD